MFECSSCKTETWYTIRELKHRKYLECPCGHRERIEPVSHVEVGYAGKATEQLDQSGERSGPAIDISDFVVSLVALGFKKADATKLVNDNIDQYQGDEGKFITFLLQQGQ